MMGCGVDSSQETGNVPLADMAPWFWLHNVPDLPGSFCLQAAQGPLYMGGNWETATELRQFKFFFKYRQWRKDDLVREIEQGLWEEVGPQDPAAVLEPYSISIPNII